MSYSHRPIFTTLGEIRQGNEPTAYPADIRIRIRINPDPNPGSLSVEVRRLGGGLCSLSAV